MSDLSVNLFECFYARSLHKVISLVPLLHLFHFNQLYINVSQAAVILQNFSVWGKNK